MDYRQFVYTTDYYTIYNSRNFKWTIDIGYCFVVLMKIYNSRNFKWTIDKQITRLVRRIYNSRNFKWTIDQL